MENRDAADGAPRDGFEDEIRELTARVGIKDNNIRELHEELAALRLSADEARVSREAAGAQLEDFERERGRLKERISTLEEELRARRRGREGYERQIERLERELDHREGEISRLEHLLARRDEELGDFTSDWEALVSRKESALEDALRRIAGLERDLEEREGDLSDLKRTAEDLRSELEGERESHRRLAEPANRLRSGLDLFNDSRCREAVLSLSRTLGPPNVHVELARGEEPPVVLTFTWQGVSWQLYESNPGLAVKEPRVYLKGAGEDLSGVPEEPPNARLGAGGRVMLGL